MSEQRTASYEAMFLIGQQQAADLASAIGAIDQVLERAGAEVIAMCKWDERRLAYEIDKQRRGLYVLTYFRASTEAMSRFERDCNLSETITRVMVLNADHFTEEEMRAHDARAELEAEAKMRSEQNERQQTSAGEAVKVGAPQQSAPQQSEEEAPGGDDEGASEQEAAQDTAQETEQETKKEAAAETSS